MAEVYSWCVAALPQPYSHKLIVMGEMNIAIVHFTGTFNPTHIPYLESHPPVSLLSRSREGLVNDCIQEKSETKKKPT